MKDENFAPTHTSEIGYLHLQFELTLWFAFFLCNYNCDSLTMKIGKPHTNKQTKNVVFALPLNCKTMKRQEDYT